MTRLPTQLPRLGQRIVDVEAPAKQHLGAIGARDRHALAGQAFRHHHQHAVALDRGDHRQGIAGVAAGGLDDGAAGLEQTLAFGARDHVFGDARLDRAGWIEEFELGVDTLDLEQRRVADRIEDAGGDACKACIHGCFFRASA